ncbi:unnamed protein product [Timema podura]|uniref:ER membrane protein complex subunit 10 n=1 Tax=Timema podura TaxID=61482 RepID=A0ABN7NN77_TIMPD|nr:unnamed protein product [Timema podura]
MCHDWSIYCVYCVKYQYQLETDHGGLLTISLRHALGQEPFVDRGRITIQSINSQSVALQQSALSNADREKLKEQAGGMLVVTLYIADRNKLEEQAGDMLVATLYIADRNKLEALSEEDGLYRLEAVVRTHDSKETLFLTFIKALCAGNILFLEINECILNVHLLSLTTASHLLPLSNKFSLSLHYISLGCNRPASSREGPWSDPEADCALVESQMSDVVTLSLSQDNNIIAVSLSTQPISGCGSLVDQHQLKTFNTTVVFRHMETGPVPDTATYVQKLEREREARERGDTKDNRSFLAKYRILKERPGVARDSSIFTRHVNTSPCSSNGWSTIFTRAVPSFDILNHHMYL